MSLNVAIETDVDKSRKTDGLFWFGRAILLRLTTVDSNLSIAI